MLLSGGILRGQRLLSPKTVTTMMTNMLPGGRDVTAMATPALIAVPERGTGFGLGLEVVTDHRKRGVATSSNGRCGWCVENEMHC